MSVTAKIKLGEIFPFQDVRGIESGYKVNTPSITGDQILGLYELAQFQNILIKRSGTGLTVMVTKK